MLPIMSKPISIGLLLCGFMCVIPSIGIEPCNLFYRSVVRFRPASPRREFPLHLGGKVHANLLTIPFCVIPSDLIDRQPRAAIQTWIFPSHALVSLLGHLRFPNPKA